MDPTAVETARAPNGAAPPGTRFEALYYPDLLQVVNPAGDVGIVTLWSPFRTVRRKLEELVPAALDPQTSRVAVIANLYGDGMYAMFCNLLFNPQVGHLIAIGEELGLPTVDEIRAFLTDGLEDAVMLGKPVTRVRGTQRVFPADPDFDQQRLRDRLSFQYLGKLSSPELGERLGGLLDDLDRLHEPHAERVRVAIPTGVSDDYAYRPSEVMAHQVVRRRPLDCWEELVVRVARFGRPVELRSGPRLELLNGKAVITEPADDDLGALAAYGFEIERFRAYQRRMLDPELPEGISYTYGNRLRGYFPQGGASTDTLQTVIDTLRAEPRTRRAYVSLWDTGSDLPAWHGDSPCLTTVFFRASEGRLTLTATYRAHNLMTAWLQNVYGLMAIQRHVAAAVGLEPGAITVVSNSLGIDPRTPRYELARSIADAWKRDDDVDRETGKFSLRTDPNGYFVVSVDAEQGLIVAEHRFGGVLVKRYAADRAVKIEQQVAADMAVTLPSHAMWLGRELTLKEQALAAAGRTREHAR